MTDLGTPPVRRVEMYLCDPCLDGEGGECHVPGCSFWMSAAPVGVPLRERQLVTVFDGHGGEDQ
jgi:hypothetical protein